MPPKSLVVNSMLTKKTKQRDGYLGSGGFSEGWAKNAPMTKAINEAFRMWVRKIFELLKCTIIPSYGRRLLTLKLRFLILDIAQ
jgi:hypothetical protein